MELSRRRFLGMGATATIAGVTLPLWLHGLLFEAAGGGGAPVGRHKLLLMYLAGGNDGLNTVVPYGMSAYYGMRSSIAIPASAVLPLPGSSTLGLHPSLSTVHDLFSKGQVAVLLGVGYDNPDLSHSGSSDVWMTGSPTHAVSTGWLGRWLDIAPAGDSPIRAVSIGYSLPEVLVGASQQGTTIPGVNGFAFYDGRDGDPRSQAYRLHSAWARCASPASAPADAMTAAQESGVRATVACVRAVQSLGPSNAPDPTTAADQVRLAVTLLDSALGVDIAVVTLSGFDDHYAENRNHDVLLKQVDDAVAAFSTATGSTGHAADFLMMTFSEFGRRVAEDGAGGTDHGTAAPLFAIGAPVIGGLYGEQPGIEPANLDVNGNMVRAIDFREAYITLLDRWLQGPTSADVLGHSAGDGLTPIAFV